MLWAFFILESAALSKSAHPCIASKEARDYVAANGTEDVGGVVFFYGAE